ncbi:MAG: NB-ARC domain-containing protein, partial [Methanoregula sp.]
MFDKLKQWTTNILLQDHNVIPEQVEHDINHIKAIMGYANILLKGKTGTDFFDVKDLFLLLSAIYLHDIGMFRGWKEFLKIKGNTAQLLPEERQRIREMHAETSGYVIRSFSKELPPSLKDTLNPHEMEILCKDLTEMLAFICESHNQRDIEKYLEREVAVKFPSNGLKIQLVTAVLQFCDALHMDKRRINTASFTDALDLYLKGRQTETAYEPEDWKRLFQCYFVEEARLIPSSLRNDCFQLRVSVKFNTEEAVEIADKFHSIYYKRLEKTRYDCKSILNKYGLHFEDDYPINTLVPDSLKIKFPRQLYPTLSKDSAYRQKKPAIPDSPSLRLFGRDTDREKIRIRVRENPHRMVMITGAPGIGKTAIAQALIDEFRTEFNNAIFFISLQGINSKDGMVARINTTLGTSQNAEEAPLFSDFKEKKQLLILDNLEDPLADRETVISFISRLIANRGRAQIVATSREALQVAAIETIHRVLPLGRDDSRSLLRYLAGMQECPEIRDSEDLEILLQELDDIPLAIVLAAPYLRHGIRPLIEDLYSNGVDALHVFGTTETSDAKEQSIRSSFYLSYRTIEGSDAARLFQIFSLFPAGLTETDTSAILAQSTHTAFITLVSKSLLDRDHSGHYTMLSPLRRYAETLLLRDNPALLDRWIGYCMEKSRIYDDIIRSGNCSASIERLVYELPNLYKALEFLLSLKEKGFEPGITIISTIKAFMQFQGLHKDAKYFLKEFCDLAHDAGDFQNEANCIQSLGDIHFMESDNVAARTAFQTAIPLYKKVGDVLGEANCIQSLGDIHFMESDNVAARTAFQTAIPLYKKVGDVLGEANCIQSLGDIHFMESDNVAARTAFQTAIPLYKKVGDVLGEA